MARTANRGTNQAVPQTSYNVLRWRLGEYIRLSKEDAQKAKKGDDSNSVINQGRLLDDYYNRHIDEFESAEKAAGRYLRKENQLRDCQRPVPPIQELHRRRNAD